jgi:hypothetical protein
MTMAVTGPGDSASGATPRRINPMVLYKSTNIMFAFSDSKFRINHVFSHFELTITQ